MRYYKSFDGNRLMAVGVGYGGAEITEEEYNALLTTIREKAALANQLYNEEITIGEVPMEWQEEIQRRVNDRIAAEGEAAEQDISGEEFVDMLEGVL
jgi:hypothetical protein